MSVSEYFRKLARRCLRLSKTAVEPEVTEQMQVWAVDLADEADRAAGRNRGSQADHRKRRGRSAELMNHQSGTRSRVIDRSRE
jgi:hypothetical protein